MYSAWDWTRGRIHRNTVFLRGIVETPGTTGGKVACVEVTIGLLYVQKRHETGLVSPWGSGLPSASRDATAVVEGRWVAGEVGGDRPHTLTLALTAVQALTHAEEPTWPGRDGCEQILNTLSS